MCSGMLGAMSVAQTVKNLPAMQETQVQSLDWEDSLEKGMVTHSNILAWRIPWTEEPSRLYSPWGLKESHMTEKLTHMCTHTHKHTHTLSQESYLRGSWVKIGDPTRVILFKGTSQANNPAILQQGLRGIKSTYLESMK